VYGKGLPQQEEDNNGNSKRNGKKNEDLAPWEKSRTMKRCEESSTAKRCEKSRRSEFHYVRDLTWGALAVFTLSCSAKAQ
jgi:hypothetical protein